VTFQKKKTSSCFLLLLTLLLLQPSESTFSLPLATGYTTDGDKSLAAKTYPAGRNCLARISAPTGFLASV
jgi:hypothetical protein